jgi:hypothetical protein
MDSLDQTAERRTHLIVSATAAIAALGVVALLLINYEPRTEDDEGNHMQSYSRTMAAARAAGATVAPSNP